jgi:hypothetical protein
MRFVIETGTDVAVVAMGDRVIFGVPRNDAEFKRKRAEGLSNGTFWRADLGADGAYLFYVYVDEEPSADLLPFLIEPQSVDRFRIASGRVLVAGEEYFVGGRLTVEKYPHMGQEIALAPGHYAFTAYAVDPPEDHTDRRFAQRATPAQRRAWARGNNIGAALTYAVIAALVAMYFVFVATASVPRTLLPMLLPVLLWFFGRSHRRTAVFQSAEALYRELERELPSVVIVLRTVPT